MIDAHQHFWRIGRNDCIWPTPDLGVICRDFEPAQLRRLAEPEGVRGSIVVQSQESDTDTDYLLALADAEPFVLGVVGWADLKAPGAPARIAALAAHPKLRAIRPMLQSLPPGWLGDPVIEPAVEAMQAHGLVLDALVRTEHLADLRAFARAHPALQIVIDHAAKPPIASGDLDTWRSELAAVAPLPNAWCKLSGLLTEAGALGDAAGLGPCVDHVLGCFGANRVLWGSDWPVVNLAGDYPGWLALARELLDGLSKTEQCDVFGGSASRLYRVNLV